MLITLSITIISGALLWTALFCYLIQLQISSKIKTPNGKPKCNHKWVFTGHENFGEYHRCSKCNEEKYDSFGH